MQLRDPLRLAFFIARADTIGGSQRHVLDLAHALGELGHDVCVFTGPRGPYNDVLDRFGVENTEIASLDSSLFSPGADRAAFKDLQTALKSFNPDLLTVHSTKSGILGRLAARRLGLPCVYTLHGVAFGPAVAPLQRAVAWAAEALMRPFTDQVIAVSDFDRNQAVNAKVVAKSKVATVRNGLPDVVARRPVSSTDRASTSMLMIARFSVPKNHAVLLEALAKLPADRQWTMRFAGDGELEDDAVRLATELGIDDRVEFLGLLSDVTDAIEESDVLLLISDREGLPISIGEGLRAGRPVIASAVGGIPEIVDGSVGWLVNPMKHGELLEALLEATDATTDLGLLGKQARARYEDRLSYNTLLRDTLATYEIALGESHVLEAAR